VKITKIKTPLNPGLISSLKAGDHVLLSGIIYTARDAAHKRLVDLIHRGKELPINLAGEIIYYTGPSPPRPGKPAGSAGPTTSCRMDIFTPELIKSAGIKAMIGKGDRSISVVEAMIEYGCVYFAATGGAAALITKSILSCKTICYEDLGAEAINRMEVKDFPLITAIDTRGQNIYRTTPL